MNNYSILINTTDSFEDCWIPFFTLFKKFWPDYSGKIYLNTETKTFSYPGLNIIPIQNARLMHDEKATWSKCLMSALEYIDEQIILYMQEDYFIKDYVKNEIIDNYVDLMQNNKDIHCIHLTDQSVKAESNPTNYFKLFPVKLKQRYRVCCQAALWDKQVLHSHLRDYETAWQFEEYGSKRSAIMKNNFYVVDKNWVKLNDFEIIPYVFTGIVQGRWYEEVVNLFAQHKIQVDFSKRGFVKDAPQKPLRKKIDTKLKDMKVHIRNYFEIIKLKKTISFN